MSDVDIYVEEQEIKVYIGEGICVLYPYLYRAEVTINSNPQTITYSLTPGLPDTIQNAELWSIVTQADRLFYMDSISDTQLVLRASVAGDPLPITIRILIRGTE